MGEGQQQKQPELQAQAEIRPIRGIMALEGQIPGGHSIGNAK